MWAESNFQQQRLTMWYNPLLTAILRSPLHPVLSGSTLALTYAGRKSGRSYTTPVNYVRDGDRLLTTSYRNRTWWRNLRGGVPVSLRLQGHDIEATGQALEDEPAVVDALFAYLSRKPSLVRYFKVGLDANGQPDRNEVAHAARPFVMIQFQLT
jgi:deazaflavin-dependent oxidoreductase (nitroreductase family)